MNPKRYEAAVEAVQEALVEMPAVRSGILFGSTARGTATDDSDIDLFIECDTKSEREVEHMLFTLGTQFDVVFTPVFYREQELHRFDLQFLESIFRHGQVLKGQMPPLTPLDLDLQPLRLVSYHTQDLDPRRRAQLLRAIDGFRTVKRVKGKRYVVEKKGFLAETGGWRVGRGAIIVTEETVEAFDRLLRLYGAKRHIIPIWSQRP